MSTFKGFGGLALIILGSILWGLPSRGVSIAASLAPASYEPPIGWDDDSAILMVRNCNDEAAGECQASYDRCIVNEMYCFKCEDTQQLQEFVTDPELDGVAGTTQWGYQSCHGDRYFGFCNVTPLGGGYYVAECVIVGTAGDCVGELNQSFMQTR